jgi:hypothetical protein
MSSSPQVWRLTAGGRTHRVEAHPGFSRRVRWFVDDELVGEKKSVEEKFRIDGQAGRLDVRFATLGAPRRATVVVGDDEVDLIPDPGSPAAQHEERVRAHPDRYAALLTVIGLARIVAPIVLAVVLARFAFSLPWPDLPLPHLTTPDLPSIPLPDWQLPGWSLPGWARWILEHAKYVWPVVVAYLIARAEIRRRRQQDERRGRLSE